MVTLRFGHAGIRAGTNLQVCHWEVESFRLALLALNGTGKHLGIAGQSRDELNWTGVSP